MISFDVQTNLTMVKFLERYPESQNLGELLSNREPIAFDEFKAIPGITKKKLALLHKTYLSKLNPQTP